MVYASINMPKEANNGIRLENAKGSELQFLLEELKVCHERGSRVLMLIMDPSGTVLA